MAAARKKKHHSSQHISTKAGLARKEFQESQHRRGAGGKFADKPGAGDDAPRTGKGLQPRTPEAPSSGSEGVRTRVMSAQSKLQIVVSSNPKRGTAAKRFDLYKDGMTIQDYVDAVGDKKQALRDLAWDMKQGWIKSPDAGTVVVRPPVKKVGGEKARYRPGSDEYKSKNTAPVPKNSRLTEDHQIYLEVGSNPKRAGAAKRFDLYKDGMTVRDYIEAVGDKRQALKDLAWDTKQGFVSAKSPSSAASRAPARADTSTTGSGRSGTERPETKKPDVKPPEAKKPDVKPPEARRPQAGPEGHGVQLARQITARSQAENKLISSTQIDAMRTSVLDRMDEMHRLGESAEVIKLSKLHQDLGDLRSNLNRERRREAEQRREARITADREAAEAAARREGAQRAEKARSDNFRDTDLLVARNGMRAYVGKNVDAKYAAQTLEKLEGIPRHAAALLDREGLTTHIGKNITETPVFRNSGHKPTDKPRGYPDGYDFYNCGGFYSPRDKVIAVAQETRRGGTDKFERNNDSSHVMLHEAGHAYDAAAGKKTRNLSNSPAFVEAYEADVQSLRSRSDWDRIKESEGYFLQTGSAGRSEVFAEGFFEISNTAPRSSHEGAHGRRIHDRFPRSAALIGRILEAGEKAYG